MKHTAIANFTNTFFIQNVDGSYFNEMYLGEIMNYVENIIWGVGLMVVVLQSLLSKCSPFAACSASPQP